MLALIALVVGLQLDLQRALHQQDHYGDAINLAARQIKLGEKLAKSAQALLEVEDPEEYSSRLLEMWESLHVWNRAQRSLRLGDQRFGMTPIPSYSLQEVLTRLEPHFMAMGTACAEIWTLSEAEGFVPLDESTLRSRVEMILRHEPVINTGMTEVVYALEEEAEQRLDDVRARGYSHLMILVTVVLAGYLTIYAPAFRRLRREIAAHTETRRGSEVEAEAKSRFLARMSGEMGLALREIQEAAQRMTRRAQGIEQVPLKLVLRNTAQLLNLVAEIDDFARVERGLRPEILTIRVLDLIDEVLRHLHGRAEERRNQVSIVPVGPVPETIQTDGVLLKQALLTLGGNALKFTENGHVRVRISCEAKTEEMRFDIIDSGIGIASSELQKIFEPFYSPLEAANHVKVGPRLGLPIARKIATTLGGELRVESVLGKGTKFSLSIATGPLQGVSYLTAAAYARVAGVGGRAKGQLRLKGRVLLLDSDAAARGRLQKLLQHAGVEVLGAESVADALKLTAGVDAASPLDAVLLDVDLANAEEVITLLGSRGIGCPIIALTSRAGTGDLQRCLGAGCDAFLERPVPEGALLRELFVRIVRHDHTHDLALEDRSATVDYKNQE